MRKHLVLFAVVAAVAAAAPVGLPRAAAQDDVVRDAVRDVLQGPDAATRERAREVLRAHPDAAVALLLQALEESVAARRPPSVVTRLEATATPAPVASGDGHIVRIHDVRDLVARAGSAEALADQLRGLLVDGETITANDDAHLIVLSTQATHGRLADRLSALRQEASEIVRIQTRVVEAPLTATLGRAVSAARAGDVVALDDPLETVARWIAAGDADVVTAPSLSCFPGQRASVNAGRELSFVADFDVEIAQSDFIADPIVETIYAGIAVELRPSVPHEGRVRLDLHATSTDVELETFTSTLGAFSETVEIQIPALRRTEIRRTIDLVDGGSVVVRMGDDPDARRFLVLTVTRE